MMPQQHVRRPFSDKALLRQVLVAQSNLALSTAAILVVGQAVMVVAFTLGMGTGNLTAPLLFFLLALSLSLALGLLAHMERVRGWVAYAVLVPFASLPTLFFLLCHAAQPSEAASYVQGPVPLLYFATVAVTGLALDFWLTSASSLVAALGFEYCLWLTRANAASGEAALSWSALLDPARYGFKPLMILVGGLTVAAITLVARQLVFRVLKAARMETALGRLFGKYIPEQAHQRLLHEPRAYTGERKQVVILCADLRGAAEYLHSTGAQELVHQLNTYFEAMVQSITLRGGAIDRFAGDSLLATFGGMVELKAPHALALEAAREMRIRLELINSSWQPRRRAKLDNSISLHVGEVVFGKIGSVLHRDFTLVGSPTHTASHVVGLPREPSYPILLTGAFYEGLPPSMKAQCRRLGTAQVPGHHAPLELYGVHEGPHAPPAQASEQAPPVRDTPVTPA